VVLQPYKLTQFLLGAPIHFLMGAPEWVPQSKDTGGEILTWLWVSSLLIDLWVMSLVGNCKFKYFAARTEISNRYSQVNPELQVSSDTVSPTRTSPGVRTVA
jgi:hypothetical protein